MDVASASGEKVHAKRRRLRVPERLPNLKGKWLALYTIAWWAVLVLAIADTGFGAYTQSRYYDHPAYAPLGIDMNSGDGHLRIALVHGAEARAAGLRYGDEIVAINGRPVPHGPRARGIIRPWIVGPEGTRVHFAIRTRDGGSRQVTLTRREANLDALYQGTGLTHAADKWINVIGTSLVGLIFIVASMLLYPLRRSPIAALLSLAFLGDGMTVTDDFWQALNLTRVNDLLSACAWALTIYAMVIFPDGRFPSRVSKWFVSLMLVTLPIPATILFGVVAASVWYGLSFVLAAGILASRFRRLPAGPERQQLRWTFLGFAFSACMLVIAVTVNDVTPSPIAANTIAHAWLPSIAQFFFTMALACFIGGLLISVLRYRLYDADAAIGRSAAYAVLTLGFVVLFAGSQKIIELIGQEYLGQNIGGFAGGVGAALAAVAIAPMHARAQRWAERSFQKSLYKLRHGLPPLVGDLRETAGLEQIAGATLDSLVEGVRTRRAALIAGERLVEAREVPADDVKAWLRDWRPPSRDGIECEESDALFPVRVPLEAEGHGRVGWLLLGARPDGSLFGKSEFDAIEEVADPVARAVQVTTSRREREERYERRFAALEEMVRQLGCQPRTSPA